MSATFPAAVFSICMLTAGYAFAGPYASHWFIYNDSDLPVFVECKTNNTIPEHPSDFLTSQISPHGWMRHRAIVDTERASWSCTASTSNTPFHEANRQILSFNVGKNEIVNLHVSVVNKQVFVVKH